MHSLPNAGQAGDQHQRVQRGRWKMLAVLAVCAAPVIASYFTYFVIRPQGRTNYSTLIQPTRSLPADLPLRTLAGQAVPASSLKGQWLLVSVGGGACDAECDKRLFLQRQLREMMGKERDRVDKVWLVTDDAAVPPPVREALSNPPTTVLRTSREALSRWLQPEPGQALESTLYLVDPMGEWMMRTPPNPDPAKLKRDLEKLLRASASWDRPGR
ncbi:SCO family protein [Ideonella sp. BN130291]|uniref:SCO family protein n=1 Tax=Ideonella sp. BN130291 TaxID=3112940 RepID=UPI002E25DE2E|nr:hypothetical protein [Ideonella sp. BN130291]